MNNNPYSIEKAAGFWDTMDNLSMAASFVPVVGGAINGIYNTGRAAGHALQGNYGKAAEHGVYALAGLIPGGAAAARLGKGAVMAGKAVQGANVAAKASTAARMAGSANKALAATGRGMQNVGQTYRAANTAFRNNKAVQSVGNYTQKVDNAVGSTRPIQAISGVRGGTLAATTAAGVAPMLWSGDAQPPAAPQAAQPTNYSSMTGMMNGLMDGPQQ
jgi:hypothetical protein